MRPHGIETVITLADKIEQHHLIVDRLKDDVFADLKSARKDVFFHYNLKHTTLLGFRPGTCSMRHIISSLGAHFSKEGERQKEEMHTRRRSGVQDLEDRLNRGERAPYIYIELANRYMSLREHEQAVRILAEGCEVTPSPQLFADHIDALIGQNRTAEAIAVAGAGRRRFPDCPLLCLREALVLPYIYRTTEEVETFRSRFATRLHGIFSELRLDTREEREEALVAAGRHNNFLLSYQMADDRELQKDYMHLVARIIECRHPELSQFKPLPFRKPGRFRIGYICSAFYGFSSLFRHSVAKTFAEWLSGHDPDRFEVFAYHSPRVDRTGEAPPGCAHFHELTGDLTTDCAAIRNDHLDAVIFLEVGMTSRLMPLAALRHAPLQCATWGHPVTTGSPEIDYYLSSELMEPPDADSQYSEKLIRLPGIGMDYRKPFIPRPLMDCRRAAFQLPDDRPLYLCCQSIQKYLPEHDHIFPRIAQRVQDALFVFLAANDGLAECFERRLEGAFHRFGLHYRDHCVVLPSMPPLKYWALNVVADVFLDSLEWSGCNSTMEAIACRLPIVTLPGRTMRGRHSYAILTQLGVTDTIAKDKDDYVDLAVRLGMDSAWRLEIVARMKENESRIYGDRRSTIALEEFLIEATGWNGSSLAPR